MGSRTKIDKSENKVDKENKETHQVRAGEDNRHPINIEEERAVGDKDNAQSNIPIEVVAEKVHDEGSTNKGIDSATDSQMSVHNALHDSANDDLAKKDGEMEEGSQDAQEIQEVLPMDRQGDMDKSEDETYNANVTVAAKEGDLSPRRTQQMRQTTSKGQSKVPLQVRTRSRDKDTNNTQ